MNAYDLAEQAKEISTTIEALEWVQNASPLLVQQAKEIERLIGAEPITYGMLTFCKNCGQQDPYTPQIKELSDEEIEQIAVKWYVGTRILPIGFARAILKKASEK